MNRAWVADRGVHPESPDVAPVVRSQLRTTGWRGRRGRRGGGVPTDDRPVRTGNQGRVENGSKTLFWVAVAVGGMHETGVTRRAFAAGAVGTLATGAVAVAGGGAGAQEGTTTTAAGGQSGDGGEPGEPGGDGETDQHGGESFRLGRDLQVMLAAVVVAVLSPIVFAVVLFARGGDRGRGPAE